MPKKKHYGDGDKYVNKLKVVMDRLQVENYDYNIDRHGAYIDIRFKGMYRRFGYTMTQSQEKAKLNSRIKPLHYPSDCFATLVLDLESLARMFEKGTYEMEAWVGSLPQLPAPSNLPECFIVLGFSSIPQTKDEIEKRYRHLSKIYHPTTSTGNEEDFKRLVKAKEAAINYLRR